MTGLTTNPDAEDTPPLTETVLRELIAEAEAFVQMHRCRECWLLTDERYRADVLPSGEVTVMHRECARLRHERKWG